MTSLHSVRDCQAKDPSTCPYHGAEHKITTAVQNGDFESFMRAQDELTQKEKSSGRTSSQEAELVNILIDIDWEDEAPAIIFNYDGPHSGSKEDKGLFFNTHSENEIEQIIANAQSQKIDWYKDTYGVYFPGLKISDKGQELFKRMTGLG